MEMEQREFGGEGNGAPAGGRNLACDMCRLRQSCLPDHLNDDATRHTLLGLVQPGVPMPRGTVLYRQGEPRRSFYFVRTGSAKSFQIDEYGRENIMGFYLPTDMIGVASLEQADYAESVVLLERSTLCEVPAEALATAARSSESMQHRFFTKMAQSFAAERHARVRLHHASADERVADFLLELSQRLHAAGRVESALYLSMSRYDIANYLGLAAETISRAFGRLQESGVIAVKGKAIDILEGPALRAIAVRNG